MDLLRMYYYVRAGVAIDVKFTAISLSVLVISLSLLYSMYFYPRDLMYFYIHK